MVHEEVHDNFTFLAMQCEHEKANEKSPRGMLQVAEVYAPLEAGAGAHLHMLVLPRCSMDGPVHPGVARTKSVNDR